MTARVVRLGTRRLPGEGLRIGTVRRPPRGVPKSEHAARDWYDVWLPELAPSAAAVELGRGAATERQWTTFAKKYRTEMAAPEKVRLLKLLAAMSHEANFSVGCYCEDESRCHRSLLRGLLQALGARIEGGSASR
jgi:uncharacterized protein YeaO (DUF488 family)